MMVLDFLTYFLAALAAVLLTRRWLERRARQRLHRDVGEAVVTLLAVHGPSTKLQILPVLAIHGHTLDHVMCVMEQAGLVEKQRDLTWRLVPEEESLVEVTMIEREEVR